MKISFVITGEEIISGFRQDKNFNFAAKRLYELGFSLYAEFIGDRREDLLFALKRAEEFADVVVCSGGLGSTSDDLTRFVASEYFGLRLKEDPMAIELLKKKYFERTGKTEIPDHLRIQAIIPETALVLPNEKGSAPGFRIKKNNKTFFFLPGVPSEFQDMFSRYVMEDIEKTYPDVRKRETITLKIFGITETHAEREIERIGIPEGVRVSYFPSFPEVIIRIYGDRERNHPFAERVKERLRNFIYAESEDITFPQHIAEILKKNNLSVATAESLTGGELANMLTDVPGASLYFKGGEIVYSPESKLELGVRRETIEQFGAVSHQCAKELAELIRKKFRSDIGISTTGVAGPEPLENKKPGLFYIGLSSEKFTESFEFMFNVGRKNIKVLCSYLALKMLKDNIDKLS